jgi:hypothetical protein
VVARRVTPLDVEWIVERLADRRRSLAAFAPTYWRPASDARLRHREFLRFLLGDGGAVGFRTDDSVVLAQPRAHGWLVDDAAVADAEWESEGAELWDALRSKISGSLRWVCPVPERERLDFVGRSGFELVESWWHRDIEAESTSGNDGGVVRVVGAVARLVPAPPVYEPGGPILFLTDVQKPDEALGDAVGKASVLGSPVVVVSQPAGDGSLAKRLEAHGFGRHCDFLDGQA